MFKVRIVLISLLLGFTSASYALTYSPGEYNVSADDHDFGLLSSGVEVSAIDRTIAAGDNQGIVLFELEAGMTWLAQFEFTPPPPSLGGQNYTYTVALFDESDGTKWGEFDFVLDSSETLVNLDNTDFGTTGLDLAFVFDMTATNTGSDPDSYAFDYDVDMLAVSSPSAVVPIPAAAWLFGSAILGIAGFNSRKRRV